ncbi:MAG: efflux RND transporter periplasmic adaptor subunit [Pseudomonadota bacterium]
MKLLRASAVLLLALAPVVPVAQAAQATGSGAPKPVTPKPLPPSRLGGDVGWSCLLEPSSRVELASETPGVLDEVLVDRGASVRKGAKLASLHSGVEEASVALARAKADFGQRKTGRNDELFAEELISTHERDELVTEAKVSEMELREAEERLRMRRLYSPIDGIVVERHKSEGEYVGSEPVFTLVRIDPLYVEVIVPASRFGSIRKGMTADVRPEAPVGGSYKATVTIVDPVIDAASGTFGVRLTLPNGERRLPAGLKCDISFDSAAPAAK